MCDTVWPVDRFSNTALPEVSDVATTVVRITSPAASEMCLKSTEAAGYHSYQARTSEKKDECESQPEEHMPTIEGGTVSIGDEVDACLEDCRLTSVAVNAYPRRSRVEARAARGLARRGDRERGRHGFESVLWPRNVRL